MSHICKQTQTRLERLADLRARGNGWATVSRELGVSVATCRRWMREHAREWKRLYWEAEQAVLWEIKAEARRVLRSQLRSADPAVARAAAKVLQEDCRKSLAAPWRQDSDPVEKTWRQDSAPVGKERR